METKAGQGYTPLTIDELEKLYAESKTCFDPGHNIFWQNFTQAINERLSAAYQAGMSTEIKQGQRYTPGAMRAAERIKHYEFNLEHAAQIIDRETNCRGLAESNRVLLEALRELLKALEPELTGAPKNVPKSTWSTQWERAEALIAAANGEKSSGL